MYITVDHFGLGLTQIDPFLARDSICSMLSALHAISRLYVRLFVTRVIHTKSGHILRIILGCSGGAYGERAAQAYNGGLGRSPGVEGQSPCRGYRGFAPLKLPEAERLLSFYHPTEGTDQQNLCRFL